MGKNIALFIDGTWNEGAEIPTGIETNVRKLYLAARNQPDQETHYIEGIGTDHLTSGWHVLDTLVQNWGGGAFGLGMGDRIKKAYQFLSKTYKPERGDNVYLFGFSRGAFAARSLAGFAQAVGVLLEEVADDSNLIESAYAAYENDTDREHNVLRKYLRDLDFPETPQIERTDLPIYFLGVWDTVAALGLPGRAGLFTAPFTEHHQTELPSNVVNARHALALHELRSRFPALLWSGPSRSGQTLEQVWFPGSHADVGGGYRSEHQWSDIALNWMAHEATTAGLRLKGLPSRDPEPTAMIHNSIRGLFALATPAVRPAVAHVEHLPSQTSASFKIHAAALKRMFTPAALAYDFERADVNDHLKMVDELTVTLHRWLAEQLPGRSAVTETPDGRNSWSSLMQEDLWKLSDSHMLERALLVQVFCTNGAVPASLRKGFQDTEEPTTKPEAKAFIKRLNAITTGIDAVIRVLPHLPTQELTDFSRQLSSAADQVLLMSIDLPPPARVIKKRDKKDAQGG